MALGWTKGRLCTVPRCDRKHWGLGYCHKHHAQWVRLGKILPRDKEYGRRVGPRPCSVEGCDKMYHSDKGCAKGMCSRHYQQVRTHGRLTPELEHAPKADACSALGCTKPVFSKCACSKHYWLRRSAAQRARLEAVL